MAMKHDVKRRRFLQLCGLTGGSLLLSSLGGRLASQVHGQSPDDRCLLVFGAANSMPFELAQGEGEDWSWAYDDHPLADLLGITSIIEDTYNPHNRGIHGNYQSFLTASGGAKRGPNGVSIDRKVAQDLAGDGSSRSINLSYPYGVTRLRTPNASADRAGARYPVIAHPARALESLFGDTTASEAERLARVRRRQSVLDAISQDITRTSSRLAGPERASMDQYLTSIRELEIETTNALDVDDACLGEEYPDEPIPFSQRVNPDVMMSLARIFGLGIACGVTRVGAFMGCGVGDDPAQPIYDFAPISSTQTLHNGITHNIGNPARYEVLVKVHLWRAEVVRTIWRQLEAAPLGDGSVADQSVLMWLNTQGRCPNPARGGNNHNRQNNIPVVLLGSAGGRLRSGRRVRYGQRERCVADAFQTAGNAVGSPMTSFGAAAHSRGAFTELLA